MRKPIRPFVTAYKSRSSKSRAPRSWGIEDPTTIIADPSLLDPGVNDPAKSAPDDDYAAAMAAADAAFGGKSVEVVAPQLPSNQAAGRILPCLLQIDERLESPVRRKAARAPRAAKSPKEKAIKPTAPNRQGKPVITAAHAQTEAKPDAPNGSAKQRERSAIQVRWVRKTELKPGEKWKRRLYAPAR